MNNFVFPLIKSINLGPLQDSIRKLDETIKAQNYPETVQYATAAAERILNSDLLEILDVRAYSYAMMGYPELAIADAQRMIGYAPTVSTGYLRKGSVLSLYGQQIQAIEAYDEGLQATKGDDMVTHRLQMARLAATGRNELRMDLIAKLPSEITNNIFWRLPLAANATCLTVSKLWRQRTLDCHDVWSDITLDEDSTGLQLSSVMQHAAHNVRYLTINSDHASIRGACFQNMRSNHFCGLQKLKITVLGTPSLRQHLSAVSTAFWIMSSTLREIDLDFAANTNGITLADILLACGSITTLKYTTQSSMAAIAGNFSMLDKHDALTSLHISSSKVTGTDIRILLQKCQKLRRLVMGGCNSTVFDPINKYAPNLEILSYNNLKDAGVLEDTVAKPPGLREIYTNNGGIPVPTMKIFPVIYKSMATLRTIYLDISSISQLDLQQLNSTYPDFKLQKLRSLTFWAAKRTDSLILRAVRDSTTLTFFNLLCVEDLSTALATVRDMPTFNTIKIQHTHNMISGTSSLTQLLEDYPTRDQKLRALSTVNFYNSAVITDDVLDSLTGVTTLRSVTLRELYAITTEGIKNFLDKTAGQLTFLDLNNLETATDECIITIGCSLSATQVYLENLPNISDQGIQDMIDKDGATHMDLTITNCNSITKDCIQHAKTKVRKITYE